MPDSMDDFDFDQFRMENELERSLMNEIREDYNEVEEECDSYRERCLYYSPMDLLAIEED